MPAQHGQTYDPQEEPAPRGGWFRLEERPYPERLDQAFRVLTRVSQNSHRKLRDVARELVTTRRLEGVAGDAQAAG